MSDFAKNMLIGLFVTAASAIVIFSMLFLHPSVGDEGQVLRARFADIDKINVGTRVTFAGKPIGEVVEIKQIESTAKDPRKPGKGGYIYTYELVMRVDSHVKVYNTDEIYSRTSGLLGEKSVEIDPKPAKPGEKVYQVNDQILYANEGGSVEETLKEIRSLSDKIEGTLDSFKYAIDELNRAKLWEKLGHTAQNLSDITDSFNKPELWNETLDHIKSLVSNADNVAITLNQPDKINQALDGVTEIATNFQNVSRNINAGEGTLGRILMKDDIYLQTKSLLSKAETILDDVNHYGVLFQNDKRWQRLRARRANLITQLQCPQEFRNYFNDELDEITTSLARINMVLQETECMDCYQSYMDDCEFRKVFAELMRRVLNMEESLKMYNEQISERECLQTELIRDCDGTTSVLTY